MDFKTIKEYYPMDKTLVGFYSTDQSFQANSFEDVANIDRWEYAPLDWSDGYYPFIYYNEDTSYFECWCFAAWHIKGYYTDDPDGEDYKLITDEPDMGITIVDPFVEDEYNVVFVPYPQDEMEEKICEFYKDDEYIKTLELAAYRWDPDSYISGKIMTTYDAVKNFVSDMEKQN